MAVRIDQIIRTQPMNMPSGQLFYLDFVYKPIKKKIAYKKVKEYLKEKNARIKI